VLALSLFPEKILVIHALLFKTSQLLFQTVARPVGTV